MRTVNSTVLTFKHDAAVVVQLNRPEVRNAIDGQLLRTLREVLSEMDDDDSIRSIILTGSDPAFCAGLDLKAFSQGDPEILREVEATSHLPWKPTRTPIIGAINGPTVAGGLELALNCDILIASDKATFADTHARVAVMPGWGLSARLPALVGRQLANYMSLSGRPIDARQALQSGLVCSVFSHEKLISEALALAADIESAEVRAVESLLQSYRLIENAVFGSAFEVETITGQRFRKSGLALEHIEKSRSNIVQRGRQLYRNANTGN